MGGLSCPLSWCDGIAPDALMRHGTDHGSNKDWMTNGEKARSGMVSRTLLVINAVWKVGPLVVTHHNSSLLHCFCAKVRRCRVYNLRQHSRK